MAGIQSQRAMAGAGDSACSIPPQTIAAECLDVIRDWTPKLAKALKVVGLINIQYCVQDNTVRSPPRKSPRLYCCSRLGSNPSPGVERATLP